MVLHMNTLPPSITPEAAAWMKAQIAMHTARAVAPLREELDRLDDWANGLFVVLADVLPPLLREHPHMAAELGPKWAGATGHFERLQANGQQRTSEGETLELLEGRKMLYRVLAVLGFWKMPPVARHTQGPGRRAA